MPILWRDQMSVCNDLIDQDHRYLICLINSIELSLKHGDTMETLPVFFKQLIDYTKFHFAREEAIQKKIQFPLQSTHHKAHLEIIDHLENLCKEINVSLTKKDELSTDDMKKTQGDIISLVREWVIDHVLKEDKRMEPYLQKMPKNFE